MQYVCLDTQVSIQLVRLKKCIQCTIYHHIGALHYWVNAMQTLII